LLDQQIHALASASFPVIDPQAQANMTTEIEQAAAQGDSVGGIIESVVLHYPAGIGEPFFDSLESVLAHYLYSIPAVKGVSFGLGFGFSDCYGSEANDAIQYENGSVITKTNHNGGINGGISNGMPIILQTCVKPTPSIYKEQDTINKETKQAEKLIIHGRHDPAVIHRACVVVDSVLALALLDCYMERSAVLELQQHRKEEIL